MKRIASLIMITASLAFAQPRPPGAPQQPAATIPDVKIQLRIANLEKTILRMQNEANNIINEVTALKKLLSDECGAKKLTLNPNPNPQTGEYECMVFPASPANVTPANPAQRGNSPSAAPAKPEQKK